MAKSNSRGPKKPPVRGRVASSFVSCSFCFASVAAPFLTWHLARCPSRNNPHSFAPSNLPPVNQESSDDASHPHGPAEAQGPTPAPQVDPQCLRVDAFPHTGSQASHVVAKSSAPCCNMLPSGDFPSPSHCRSQEDQFLRREANLKSALSILRRKYEESLRREKEWEKKYSELLIREQEVQMQLVLSKESAKEAFWADEANRRTQNIVYVDLEHGTDDTVRNRNGVEPANGFENPQLSELNLQSAGVQKDNMGVCSGDDNRRGALRTAVTGHEPASYDGCCTEEPLLINQKVHSLSSEREFEKTCNKMDEALEAESPPPSNKEGENMHNVSSVGDAGACNARGDCIEQVCGVEVQQQTNSLLVAVGDRPCNNGDHNCKLGDPHVLDGIASHLLCSPTPSLLHPSPIPTDPSIESENQGIHQIFDLSPHTPGQLETLSKFKERMNVVTRVLFPAKPPLSKAEQDSTDAKDMGEMFPYQHEREQHKSQLGAGTKSTIACETAAISSVVNASEDAAIHNQHGNTAIDGSARVITEKAWCGTASQSELNQETDGRHFVSGDGKGSVTREECGPSSSHGQGLSASPCPSTNSEILFVPRNSNSRRHRSVVLSDSDAENCGGSVKTRFGAKRWKMEACQTSLLVSTNDKFREGRLEFDQLNPMLEDCRNDLEETVCPDGRTASLEEGASPQTSDAIIEILEERTSKYNLKNFTDKRLCQTPISGGVRTEASKAALSLSHIQIVGEEHREQIVDDVEVSHGQGLDTKQTKDMVHNLSRRKLVKGCRKFQREEILKQRQTSEIPAVLSAAEERPRGHLSIDMGEKSRIMDKAPTKANVDWDSDRGLRGYLSAEMGEKVKNPTAENVDWESVRSGVGVRKSERLSNLSKKKAKAVLLESQVVNEAHDGIGKRSSSESEGESLGGFIVQEGESSDWASFSGSDSKKISHEHGCSVDESGHPEDPVCRKSKPFLGKRRRLLERGSEMEDDDSSEFISACQMQNDKLPRIQEKSDKKIIDLWKESDKDDDSEEYEADSESEGLGGFIVGSEDSDSKDGCVSSKISESSSHSQQQQSSGADSQTSSQGSFSTSEDSFVRFKRTVEHRRRSYSWDFEADMLAVLATDSELCLRAVCALYRQQTEDEKREKGSKYINGRGFDIAHAYKGSSLAEFLTEGYSSGPLKKSVQDLERRYPKGVDYCRKLALHHSKQLFQIYQNREDSHFPFR